MRVYGSREEAEAAMEAEAAAVVRAVNAEFDAWKQAFDAEGAERLRWSPYVTTVALIPGGEVTLGLGEATVALGLSVDEASAGWWRPGVEVEVRRGGEVVASPYIELEPDPEDGLGRRRSLQLAVPPGEGRAELRLRSSRAVIEVGVQEGRAAPADGDDDEEDGTADPDPRWLAWRYADLAYNRDPVTGVVDNPADWPWMARRCRP